MNIVYQFCVKDAIAIVTSLIPARSSGTCGAWQVLTAAKAESIVRRKMQSPVTIGLMMLDDFVRALYADQFVSSTWRSASEGDVPSMKAIEPSMRAIERALNYFFWIEREYSAVFLSLCSSSDELIRSCSVGQLLVGKGDVL
jgi:hypothetical protein